MNKAMLSAAATFSFSFLGLFGGSDQEYGGYTGALKRTMAQDLPPYHETADTTQRQIDSGVAPGPNAPATPNPPAASEQTPKVQ
jgi:hypothetical protein